MSTNIIFPYQFKTTPYGQLPNPVIHIPVITVFGLRKIAFLVDSGSDTLILPLRTYGPWFNFTPKLKNKTTLGGVEGKGVNAYPGKIAFFIGNTKIIVRCYFIESNTIPLLGRLDLWDKFSWYFDNKNQQVIFETL